MDFPLDITPTDEKTGQKLERQNCFANQCCFSFNLSCLIHKVPLLLQVTDGGCSSSAKL